MNFNYLTFKKTLNFRFFIDFCSKFPVFFNCQIPGFLRIQIFDNTKECTKINLKLTLDITKKNLKNSTILRVLSVGYTNIFILA